MTLFPEAGFQETATADAAATRHFSISKHSRCFDGHFDAEQVLPGVAHIALALSACAARDGRARVLVGVSDLRFKQKLLPGDGVDVILTAGRAPASVRFEIRRGNEVATVGVLQFAPDDDPRHG